MAETIKDAYGEILRLRNEYYQKWQEAPQYDENRGAYRAKYEAYDKALELMTPCIVDERPEPISPADVGFEALGKAWDKEAKKDSGELGHSATKTRDQVESVKPKFKVGDKIYKNVLTGSDEQWEVEKIDEEKGEYHIRNMFIVNGLCFEDQDDWELLEQNIKEE